VTSPASPLGAISVSARASYQSSSRLDRGGRQEQKGGESVVAPATGCPLCSIDTQHTRGLSRAARRNIEALARGSDRGPERKGDRQTLPVARLHRRPMPCGVAMDGSAPDEQVVGGALFRGTLPGRGNLTAIGRCAGSVQNGPSPDRGGCIRCIRRGPISLRLRTVRTPPPSHSIQGSPGDGTTRRSLSGYPDDGFPRISDCSSSIRRTTGRA
jgi:hypothetical protein